MNDLQKSLHISEYMKLHSAKGVKGEFIPKSQGGEDLEARTGYLYGLHPKLPPVLAVSSYRKGLWSISHIGTGGLIMDSFATKKEAEQYVCLCLLLDWDLGDGIPERTSRAMKLISKGVRGGIRGGDVGLAAKLHDMLEL